MSNNTYIEEKTPPKDSTVVLEFEWNNKSGVAYMLKWLSHQVHKGTLPSKVDLPAIYDTPLTHINVYPAQEPIPTIGYDEYGQPEIIERISKHELN